MKATEEKLYKCGYCESLMNKQTIKNVFSQSYENAEEEMKAFEDGERPCVCFSCLEEPWLEDMEEYTLIESKKRSELEQSQETLKAIELAHKKKEIITYHSVNSGYHEDNWAVYYNDNWHPVMDWYKDQLEQEGN
jgi:hypothetical protein